VIRQRDYLAPARHQQQGSGCDERRHGAVTDIILIPGMWLDGSSWEVVLPVLERAGHRAHPLTLPGMESKDADRATVSLSDHVGAVVTAIDSIPGEVVLVGHSAGAAIAYAAVDARPGRIARAIYVSGFPTADGDALVEGFQPTGGEIPLPDWPEFEAADLGGLDDAARLAFRERAIPFPGYVVSEPQRLSDDGRYDVPVTVICTEFSAAMLREWIGAGLAPVREFARIRAVEYVDLPTGHWPQFTRPSDLGQAILASITSRTA
jgi:pimeloyl-ACP methyl ester carboxylesterase